MTPPRPAPRRRPPPGPSRARPALSRRSRPRRPWRAALPLALALLLPLAAPAGAAPGPLDGVPAAPAAAPSEGAAPGADAATAGIGAGAAAPAAAAPSDEEIAARLERILERVPPFGGIEAEVAEGVVTLRGRVATEAAAREARAVAAALGGVIYVVDELQPETNARRSLAPVAERLSALGARALALLPLLAVALLLALLFVWLGRRVARLEAPWRRLGLNPFLRSLVRQLAGVLVALTGVLLALDVVGAGTVVTALLGTAGVAGLAVGFAFRDIVENYLAGILMSVRQPFSQDDLIRVGDTEGRVLRMTSRDLVLMDIDGNHIRVPNSTVFKSLIVNYTRNPLRRFSFRAGVDANEDLRRAQAVGVAALAASPGVLADPAPFALVEELGDYSVIVSFHGWTDQAAADFPRVRSQGIRRTKEALDAAGVLLPEPIQNVRVQRVPPGARLGEAAPGGGDPEPSGPAPRGATMGAAPGGAPGAAPDVTADVAAAARVDPRRAAALAADVDEVDPADPLEPQIRRDRAASEEEDLLDDRAR